MFDDDLADDNFADVPDTDTVPVPVPSESQGKGGYASELQHVKVRGRQRTFYFDLKESHNGKFVKVSELSRGGQRSTIMFDGEDIDEMISALQEIKSFM
ncbi:MAG: hypothetical protein P1V18_01530 [Candidatus Gracilibacteria bacterium]|nr:hypothetical protein [Candidatus Gracilibacteria bacterium]